MNSAISDYNDALAAGDRVICDQLAEEITARLTRAESKTWHRHPVWFIDGNPIVGYSRQKAGIRLMFWSGARFEEVGLTPGTGKFKDASVFYASAEQIDHRSLRRWLKKAQSIQWDYKNVVKRKCVLERVS